MEDEMELKRRLRNPKGSLRAGMVFLLVALFASMIADGRLLGAYFAQLIQDKAMLHTIQVFAGGFALPMFFAAIFFNLRSISMRRSQ